MQGGSTDTLRAPPVPPEEVYVTEELGLRPTRSVDYHQEKSALQELAERMADDPEAVLPRFVQLAMEITGADSAGLSLYEPEPEPGVFRWKNLHGSLARFEGATTPRNHSPCGVTLDRDGPVLAVHPERAYNWIAEAGLELEEVLLVPLRVGRSGPVGTLWMVAGSGHFRTEDARIATELAGFVATALRMIAAEERLREALHEQELLAREMSHRVKNVFALTESMIRLTASKAASPQAMAEALTGRLRAMSEAHALTRRKADSLSGRESTDLDELIEAILKPHERTAAGKHRISAEGPSLSCGPHAANGIALLLHELATNAVKYGALSTDGGRVDVRWSREGDSLRLEWRETGGPEVEAQPVEPGFGTTLVRRMVAGQFAGAFDQQWPREGLSCTITLSADRLDH